MSESLFQLAEQMFVGPIWPASILVCLLIVYTMFAMLGLIDFGLDAPDIDLDVPSLDVDVPGMDVPDLDVDVPDMDVATADLPDGGIPADWDFWQGIGAASVRWTNFGRVPVLIWAGLFALAYWGISFLLWHGYDSARYAPNWLPSVFLSIRNIVLAVAVTKALTQPLVGYFVGGPSYDSRNLIGATCEVTTSEVTDKHGQGKFRTQAAPLLLNIRTDGPHIQKGTEVKIVDFDKTNRTYTVTRLPSEKHS